MKHLLIILLLILIPLTANAERDIPGVWYEKGNQWDKDEVTMEIVWQALHIMDWYQTRQIVDDPNYWEMNPLIGKDPTRGQVNSWMAGFAVGHLVTSHFLPKEYKKWFQGISLGAKGATVIWNYRVGLKF